MTKEQNWVDARLCSYQRISWYYDLSSDGLSSVWEAILGKERREEEKEAEEGRDGSGGKRGIEGIRTGPEELLLTLSPLAISGK